MPSLHGALAPAPATRPAWWVLSRTGSESPARASTAVATSRAAADTAPDDAPVRWNDAEDPCCSRGNPAAVSGTRGNPAAVSAAAPFAAIVAIALRCEVSCAAASPDGVPAGSAESAETAAASREGSDNTAIRVRRPASTISVVESPFPGAGLAPVAPGRAPVPVVAAAAFSARTRLALPRSACWPSGSRTTGRTDDAAVGEGVGMRSATDCRSAARSGIGSMLPGVARTAAIASPGGCDVRARASGDGPGRSQRRRSCRSNAEDALVGSKQCRQNAENGLTPPGASAYMRTIE